MRSKLFRIGLGAGLAVFMGAVAVFGCALPRFVRAESVSAGVVATESANVSGAAHEIVSRTDDEVVYTTTQGLAVKKQNATLYMTINGTNYEIVGQGDGTNNSISGYIDLEYVQSTGAQRFSTGFTPNNNSAVEVVFSTTRLGSSESYYQNIFCARGSDYDVRTFSAFITNSTVRFDYYNINNANTSLKLTSGTKYIVYANKNVVYINGTKYYTHTATTFTAGGPLYIGAGYYNGTSNNVGSWSYMKYYSIKVWDNGTLIRNMTPVENSSGVAGFYDSVNDKFYSSETSTAFVSGETVLPEWSTASVYSDSSPAATAISSDTKSGNKSLAGIASVGGVDVGYLVVKNGSNYLKVRI